jgi:hypothetical protein
MLAVMLAGCHGSLASDARGEDVSESTAFNHAASDASVVEPDETDDSGETGSEDPCEPRGDPFAGETLLADIAFLAADERGGRAPGSSGDEQTRAYIAARFECLGLDALADGYQQPFSTEDGSTTANVVAILRGSDPTLAQELVVIGAHHDHRGRRGKKIFNGANDNASGVAVLLAVAKAMSDLKMAPARSVVFASFGSEETGYEGSKHFVMQAPGITVEDAVFMINLDMVGSYEDNEILYGLGADSSPTMHSILSNVGEGYPDIHMHLDETAEESDFIPFCEAGTPFVFFFTEDLNCYHKACDDVEGINLDALVSMTPMITEFSAAVANTNEDLAALRSCMQ